VLVLGCITMVLGAIMAVFSTNLKYILACSSLSQIGFILVGVAMLTLLGELVYEGKDGIHKDVREARRFWKKAAETGDVLALVALGDDCIASGKGPGAALRYYRKAQKMCCLTPDIAYLPQVKLRMAQYETRFTSRWLALAQLAEAKRGFAIRKREGDGDVSSWLEEADALIRQLLEEQNR
ncbi:MAG: hypothetical protein EGQ64_00875, partial [Ruminococcaceae bacterium]|nr:hypothetical protein [Oscillospiraceae bacterium]